MSEPSSELSRASVVRQSGSLARGMSRYERYKSPLERVAALLVLLALSPLMLAIGLAIRLDSPGPAIYRQRRLGKNGREFTMYKFRTMMAEASDGLHRAAFERFAKARSLEETGESSFKLRGDPRVTRFGRFLRSTSLDELPQIINVLNGTMSLVGPRPPIPYETEYYQPHHWDRLLVKPGITGPWQAFGRSKVSLEQMVDMDLDYVAHQSPLLDLRIMARTIQAVLSRDGAG